MVKLSAEQERLSSLISETVTLLCRNGLKFKSELKVQGLLGISLDDEVFLVQIEKSFEEMVGDKVAADMQEIEQSSGCESEREPYRKRRKVKRKPASSPIILDSTEIKCEPVNDVDDDLMLLETDTKIDVSDKNSVNKLYKDNNCQGFNSPYVSEMNITTNTTVTDQKSAVWDDPLGAITSTSQENSQTSATDNMANVTDMLDPQSISSQTLEPLFSHQQQSYFNQSGENQHMLDQSWTLGSNYPERNRRHWPLPGGGTREMNVLAPYMRSFGRQRRTPTSSSKQFICGYPGCDKSYFSRTNMLHHQAYKHGRQKGEPGPCIVKDVRMSDNSIPTQSQNAPQIDSAPNEDASFTNTVNKQQNGTESQDCEVLQPN